MLHIISKRFRDGSGTKIQGIQSVCGLRDRLWWRGGHEGLHFALHGQNLSNYICTNERLCTRLGSSYLRAVVCRITQCRERWFHRLPSHNDHGTASVQQALWLGASVPVPVARPVPVPNIHVSWKLVIGTEYEPVMIHKYRVSAKMILLYWENRTSQRPGNGQVMR